MPTIYKFVFTKELHAFIYSKIDSGKKSRYRHKITVLSLSGLTSVKIELISLSIGGETRERETERMGDREREQTEIMREK